MLVEVMAVVTEIGVATVVTLSDMPPSDIRKAGIMVLPCAVAAATIVRCLRVGMRAMQGARTMRLGAVAGEAVTGIRTLDIPGLAITARATGIRMGAILAYDTGRGMVPITGIDRS